MLKRRMGAKISQDTLGNAGVEGIEMQAEIEAAPRAIVIVIDGCGVGAAPDAADFGDGPDCNSIVNTAKAVGGLALPNLDKLGLSYLVDKGGGKENAPKQAAAQNDEEVIGSFGKLKEKSNGKDTQTGHWEMMGVINNEAFPTYPDGFPEGIITRFVQETGCGGILCNKPASGTVVLEQFGLEHQKTGYPIVYTSGDSVFQIATHVDLVPLETLYKWCGIARGILSGPDRVGRVIARPFAGDAGSYKRLGGDRRDYAVPPPAPTLLDRLLQHGLGVLGIGKIEDIFCRQGISHAKHTGSNREGLELTLAAIQGTLPLEGLAIKSPHPQRVPCIFTNLVDTDMLFGHRRDAAGYARALLEIDAFLSKIIQSLRKNDLLIITSDHGNDPTAPGTDHTREYVPLLMYSPNFVGQTSGQKDLGVRDGFVDIAASLAAWLGVPWDGPGISFVPALSKVS